jgi:hypothetical protein
MHTSRMHASTITMMDEIDRQRCHRSRRSLRSYHLHQAQSTRNRSPRLPSIPELFWRMMMTKRRLNW